MAYLKMVPFCQFQGCPRKAEAAVYNRMNAHLGDFCMVHARDRLRRAELEEAEDDRNRAKLVEGGDFPGAVPRDR